MVLSGMIQGSMIQGVWSRGHGLVAIVWGLQSWGMIMRWYDRGAGMRSRGGVWWEGTTSPLPTVNNLTDTCENITFPQLRLRTVIIKQPATPVAHSNRSQ